MQTNGKFRIVKASEILSPVGSIYDNTHSYMQGYEIDLTRKTAALMRQSKKGADQRNPESRLRQEGLISVAVEIRADHDPLMVLPCDEGSGVSGQKKIYERPKFLELWRAIQDGTVGSVIVAREDRLFRDRFLTQVTQFAEECAKHGVILIVAGRRCYDFRFQDDFNAFIRRMQEAYAYIDTHIKYMLDMRQQKLQRGEWVGNGLIAPYVLDRAAINAANELRKTIKEFGGSEEEEHIITQAFRPIIYEPWHDTAIDLFEKFRLFDFSRSRLGRYVEEKKYIFPLPMPEDNHRYLFRVNMTLVPGLGYTFADSIRLPRWLANLMHIGYAPAGEDEQGNHVYIEGAFDASIPRDLFEQCYEAATGFTLDGEPVKTERNRSRFIRKYPRGLANALLSERFTSPDIPMRFTAKHLDDKRSYYYALLKPGTENDEDHGEEPISVWESHTVWTMPVRLFDKAIVDRLAELAEHDKELASRVEEYYNELNKGRDTEKKAILSDISNLEALIARYDKLLVDPAQPLTVAQEKRYLKAQADAEADLERAKAALVKYEKSQPGDFIPLFYRILGHAPGEFWNMDVDRQRRMMSLLVEEIQVKNISPHLYRLLLKWKDPVAQRWDCALIFKRNMTRSRPVKQDWTAEEDEMLRQLWPTADRFEIYKALPTKSGVMLNDHASELGVQSKGLRPTPSIYIHRSLCYDDWSSACAALDVDQESEEGLQVLEMLNYYARTTFGQPVTFWWILPAIQMSYLGGDWTHCTRDTRQWDGSRSSCHRDRCSRQLSGAHERYCYRHCSILRRIVGMVKIWRSFPCLLTRVILTEQYPPYQVFVCWDWSRNCTIRQYAPSAQAASRLMAASDPPRQRWPAGRQDAL
jgi:hypothetical protein